MKNEIKLLIGLSIIVAICLILIIIYVVRTNKLKGQVEDTLKKIDEIESG